MDNTISKHNLNKELPSHFADKLGVDYAEHVNKVHKKENGQYFTPLEIATFMASYSEFSGKKVRILDPGCGTAVLSCALIEYLIETNKSLESIELIAYETDINLLSKAQLVLDYLKVWVTEKNIDIKTTLYSTDFVLHNADYLKDIEDLFSKTVEPFDIVISNPPYFKLSINDQRTLAAKVIVNGHPNIYAIFMALAARLLKKNGELIFITPRSYAAGGYFRQFRGYFFNLIELQKAHLFASRKDTFSRDKVLQETVIIKGNKKPDKHTNSHVIISSSAGLKDLKQPLIKKFPKKYIIDESSKEKILYLPTSDYEESIVELFKSWNGNLAKYNIKISTGPVVAFRAQEYITEYYENDKDKLAPLFWMHNVKRMILEWPIAKTKKGQFIVSNEKSRPLLIPNKNYIFLRRFSSKDDKNRLIAAPYFCNFINSDYIGVENKVNYIYRQNGHLERNEVVGLCALLNSTFFDDYFRIFNGNVNVSATELREMSLPPLEDIQEIGNDLILSNNYSIDNINTIVNYYLKPTLVNE